MILEVIYGFEKSNDFNSRNYTLITTKPNEALVQYVNDNINEYMDVLLDNCFDFINDEERAALAILNNPEIDINHKERYIGYLKTEIGRIDDVKDKELWELLLQRKLVKCSESNILKYFFLKGNGLDSQLVAFINESKNNLQFDCISINDNYGEESASKFFKAIVSCNEISNEKYRGCKKFCV